MIRMIQSKSAAAAIDYFRAALAQSDYYINDQELPGIFKGKLAERLGLAPGVTEDVFTSLCKNINPVTGENLTPRTNDNRTPGYDISFSVPKSVSIVHALSNDNHILDAFQASVEYTMKELEADSMTRVRLHGEDTDRMAGELIYGLFIHQTSRAVNNHVADPQLHAHCYCINSTWDPLEQKIKACQFREIQRNLPYHRALFHKHLSDQLQEMGYEIRKTKDSYEIVGVPKEAINLFSKRRNQIERVAKEKGITNAKQLDQLGAATRTAKQKGQTMAELKAGWRKQIIEAGIKQEPNEPFVRFAEPGTKEVITPDKCVDFSIADSFERASVKQHRRVLASALTHAIGSKWAKIDDIKLKFNSDKRLIRIEENGVLKCTTHEVLAEEKQMVDLARQGQGTMRPLYKVAPEIKLKDQQGEAVRHVLTNANLVSIIRGAAGTGKTTLMGEAVRLINKAGKDVFVVAPTGEASRGELRKQGFKDAETVAMLLTNKKLQASIKDQVLWVDEAGMLGTKDALALIKLCKEQNAKLIYGGDTLQHSSVVRGDALRILNVVGGIQVSEVSKIYRQETYAYRKAVECLSKGQVADGFMRLDKIGFIKAIDPESPNKELVRDYLTALKAGKSALIVSPTHKQIEAVTKDIREALRAEKMIGSKETKMPRLINLNLTEAAKGDWRNLEQGQAVQFNQNVKGIKRGSLWTVEKIADQYIGLSNEQGESRSLPLDKPKTYDVFEKAEIAVSSGDKLRVTRNGCDMNKEDLSNGQTLIVESLDKEGNIRCRKDGSKKSFTINKNYGHIAHAHAITSNASQGKTVDRVFISQPTTTFEASNAKQFYVSASRAKERAYIYTDDKPELLRRTSEMGDRQSALELLGSSKKHKDHIAHLQRQEPAKEATPEAVKERQQNKRALFEGREYEPRL